MLTLGCDTQAAGTGLLVQTSFLYWTTSTAIVKAEFLEQHYLKALY